MGNEGRPLSGRRRLRRSLLRVTGLGLSAGGGRRHPAPVSAPRRWLLIRPDQLGDLLWLTPGLGPLRERYPEAEITVAVGPWNREVLASNPAVDRLLTIDFPGLSPRPKGGPLAPYTYLARVARRLRAHHFDAAVVLRDDHWWGALLAAAAGIPRRFGYALPDVAPFLTDALPPPSRRHAVSKNIALLDAALAAAGRAPILAPGQGGDADPAALPPVFHPWREDEERATAILAPLAREGRAAPLVAIHASAGVPVKLWDEGRWAAVADRLVAEFGARIVLTGGPGDESLVGEIARRMSGPALDLAGRTSIGALAATLARCAAGLGTDNGALHLAVAVGTPTVHLYGPADPVLYGPWGDAARHRVVSAGLRCDRCGDLSPARPRGATCMLAIGVEDVLRAVRPLLAGRHRQ